METIAHKNYIVTLPDSDGSQILDHEQKANILWDSFKNRMGVSEFSGISYNLS